MKNPIIAAIAICVGGMFGSAIFSLSGLTIKNAGNGALLSWLFAGAIMLGFGFVAANLSKLHPQSGGMYNYPAKIFHSDALGGFSALLYWFGCAAGVCFSSVYFGKYFTALIPSASFLEPIIAIIPILIGMFIILGKFTNLSSSNLILTFALIAGVIIICIVLLFSQVDQSASQAQASSGDLLQSIFETPTAILAFGAIVAPSFLSGQLGVHSIKKVMAISIGITCALYLFVMATVLLIVPANYWEENPGAEYSPLESALANSGAGQWLGVVINICALLALFTTILVLMRLAIEAIDISAKSHALPVHFENWNMNVWINVLLFAIVISFFGFIQDIVNSGVLVTVAFDLVICASLFKASEGAKKILPVIVGALLIACYIPSVAGGNWLIWAVFLIWSAIVFAAISYSLKSSKRTKSTTDLNSHIYNDALAIRKTVFIGEQNVSEELEVEDEDKAVHYVSYIGKTPVATMRYTAIDRELAKLQRLAVMKNYRGKRIGAKLFDMVEKELKESGFKTVELDGQSYLRDFYLNRGYTQIGDEFVEAGIDHFLFRKSFSN